MGVVIFNKFYKIVKYRLGFLCICRAQYSTACTLNSFRGIHDTRVTPKLWYKIARYFFFSHRPIVDRILFCSYIWKQYKMLLTRVICYLRLFVVVFFFDTLQQICQNTFTSLNCSFAVEMCQEFPWKEKMKNLVISHTKKKKNEEIKSFPWITINI